MKTNLLLAAMFVLLSGFITADWITYQPEDRSFKVQFPTKPIETSSEIATEVGTLKMTMLIGEPTDALNSNLGYILLYMHMPKSVYLDENEMEKMLDEATAGIEQKGTAKVLKEERITYRDRYPGRRLKISLENGQAYSTARTYVINHSVYMLQVVYLPQQEGNADIDKFFDSLDVAETVETVDVADKDK